MKVLHIVPTLNPQDGGTTTSVIDIASGLRSKGVDVTIATTDGEEKDKNTFFFKEVEREFDIEVICFRANLPKKWKKSNELSKWLDMNSSGFDVIHSHSVFCFPSIAASKYSAKYQVPHVISPAGMLDQWPMSQNKWKKKIYYHIFEKEGLELAKAIHTTSSDESKSINKLGFGHKVREISLGLRNIQLENYENKCKVNSELRVLYLSRIHPKKRLIELVEAINYLGCKGYNVCLDIVGEGEKEYTEKVIQLVANLKLEEKIKFHGFLRGKEKRERFLEADLFVLPSFQENFGIAIVEAMSYGVPVIITSSMALADDVNNYGAGDVIPVNSKSSISNSIVKFFNEDYHKECSKNALRLVKERFDLDKTVCQMIDLYKSIQ